jgi:hypothetical protein
MIAARDPTVAVTILDWPEEDETSNSNAPALKTPALGRTDVNLARKYTLDAP